MKKYEIAIRPFTEEEKEAYRLRFKHALFRQLRALFRKRSEQGLTQKAIALRLGTDEALVSRRLRGEANLTLASLCDLARAMDARLEPNVRPLEEVRPVQAVETATRPTLFTLDARKYYADALSASCLERILIYGFGSQMGAGIVERTASRTPEELGDWLKVGCIVQPRKGLKREAVT